MGSVTMKAVLVGGAVAPPSACGGNSWLAEIQVDGDDHIAVVKEIYHP